MDNTTINYLPENYAEDSVTMRSNVSTLQIENAMQELLASVWSGTIITSNTPPVGEYLCLNLKESSAESDSNSIITLKFSLTATLKNRELLVENFNNLALYFPIYGDVVDDIQFAKISVADNPSFNSSIIASTTYYTGTLELEAEVELLTSEFSEYEDSDDDENEISYFNPLVLENAMVTFIEDECDFDSSELETDFLMVSEVNSPLEEEQIIKVKISLEGSSHDDNFAALALLSSKLPQENISITLENNSKIIIWAIECSAPLTIELDDLWHAEMTLQIHLDYKSSIFLDSDSRELDTLEDSSNNSSLVTTISTIIDPDDLESDLTDFLATELSISVDTDIWRGVVPAGKNGIGVMFFSQVYNTSNGCVDCQFKIAIRSSDRSDAMQKLSAITSIFPVTNELDCKEILCTQAELSQVIEQGNRKTEGAIILLLRFER